MDVIYPQCLFCSVPVRQQGLRCLAAASTSTDKTYSHLLLPPTAGPIHPKFQFLVVDHSTTTIAAEAVKFQTCVVGAHSHTGTKSGLHHVVWAGTHVTVGTHHVTVQLTVLGANVTIGDRSPHSTPNPWHSAKHSYRSLGGWRNCSCIRSSIHTESHGKQRNRRDEEVVTFVGGIPNIQDHVRRCWTPMAIYTIDKAAPNPFAFTSSRETNCGWKIRKRESFVEHSGSSRFQRPHAWLRFCFADRGEQDEIDNPNEDDANGRGDTSIMRWAQIWVPEAYPRRRELKHHQKDTFPDAGEPLGYCRRWT